MEYLKYLARLGTSHIHPAGFAASERMLELLDPCDGHRVLDIGCGAGGTLAEVVRRAGVRGEGIDILPEMLHAARRRLQWSGAHRSAALIRADGGHLPFPNASYDCAYAESVLAIQDGDRTRAMLREVFRVLKPGGLFAANEAIWKPSVTDPLAAEINAKCRRYFGLPQASERAWHVEDWIGLMEDAGFEVVSCELLENHAPNGRRGRSGWSRMVQRPHAAAFSRLRALLHPATLRQRKLYRRRLAEVSGLGANVEARLFVGRKRGSGERG